MLDMWCCAHQCTLAITDPPIFFADYQWVFVPMYGPIGPAVWPPILDMGCCAHFCARMDAHSLSPTPLSSSQSPNGCLCPFMARSVQPFGRLYWTTQHRTETILEKYNILEPVSVGGWTNIRLRRITRSSTCVCLRIRNYFFAARTPHSNFALAAVAAPCSTTVPSRFALV
jgi:hypothetical protein